ncbi:MAG: polysaccharide deacetylase [Pseudomonadota bacterium]|nr:polysaccharide deacetylase [Pseudomonadota bacterium]
MPDDQTTAKDVPWHWPEEKWRGIVNKVRAGRSLKPKSWPGGAKVGVALSFDSDHETSTLRFGESSPGKLSQGEYGSRVGVRRIRECLARHDIKASFFVPAVVAELHPDEQKAVVDDGHEVGIHGWIHEFNSDLTETEERDIMMGASDVLERITGKRPVGIRTPSWDFTPYTLKICREMELLYDSSLMADDEPYELLENGEPTGLVELPVEWIKDDAPYMSMDRRSTIRPHTSPLDVLDIFKAEFDGAYVDEGLCLITMHPHVIGHRSRMRILEGLIAHIRSHDGVWFGTHEEVARHCLDNAE